MTLSPWQQRIQRAEELAAEHQFAAEILRFYMHVARFQQDLHQRLSKDFSRPEASNSFDHELGEPVLSALSSMFNSFLSLTEAHGPNPLAELSHELSLRRDVRPDLLNRAWLARPACDAQDFLVQAFLQPYAELLRSQKSLRPSPHKYALCPICNRKPGFGVLRQMGDGAARSLVCSFCLAEWEFRRLVCPGCGEENDKKLPVFTATDFDHIRVEACDACNTYLKSVDLTRNGRAEPLVDELASAPLDLWAHEHGYAKLQNNMLGM